MFAKGTGGHGSMERKSSGREGEPAKMVGGQAARTRRVFANSYKEEGSNKSRVYGTCAHNGVWYRMLHVFCILWQHENNSLQWLTTL